MSWLGMVHSKVSGRARLKLPKLSSLSSPQCVRRISRFPKKGSGREPILQPPGAAEVTGSL